MPATTHRQHVGTSEIAPKHCITTQAIPELLFRPEPAARRKELPAFESASHAGLLQDSGYRELPDGEIEF